MNSMTGYGRGESTNGNVTVIVEMKSVNNRFRDINVRLPREYMVLEPRVHKALKDHVNRGRLDTFIRRSANETKEMIQPDPFLAEHYLKAMNEVAKRLQRLEEPIPLSLVLSQPGVLTPVAVESDALSEWALVETALDAAREELCKMRAVEGKVLQEEMVSQLDQMQRLWAEVQASADGVAKRLHDKLEERLTRLIGDRIEPHRLAQESALLADKSDISEELVRIRSHTTQVLEALHSDEPVGRKLDFLLQELNREINTIGSKAAEHPIAARVVEMKSVLEKMREQAANIE